VNVTSRDKLWPRNRQNPENYDRRSSRYNHNCSRYFVDAKNWICSRHKSLNLKPRRHRWFLASHKSQRQNQTFQSGTKNYAPRPLVTRWTPSAPNVIFMIYIKSSNKSSYGHVSCTRDSLVTFMIETTHVYATRVHY
jgi:hypothetical protein